VCKARRQARKTNNGKMQAERRDDGGHMLMVAFLQIGGHESQWRGLLLRGRCSRVPRDDMLHACSDACTVRQVHVRTGKRRRKGNCRSTETCFDLIGMSVFALSTSSDAGNMTMASA